MKDKDGDFRGLRYTNVSWVSADSPTESALTDRIYSRTTVKARDGGMREVAMMLYDEREIERAAWRKHGGPEGFVS